DTDSKEEVIRIVLTKPLSIDGTGDSHNEYKAPNMLQRALTLFKDVRPGSDLTRLQASLIFYLYSFLFFFVSIS
ncbi:hypothetical protein PanWU01x14_233420, partial [Parasponia andersonii]